MNPVILSLLLAFQGGPVHAELHPANADLYLAVPDVQGIVDAYGQAPVLQTVNDATMREFLAGISGELTGDSRALLAGWVDQVVPGGGALVDEMRALSLSFALGAGGEKSFGIELVASLSTVEHALAMQKLALDAGTPAGSAEASGLTGAQRFTCAELEDMQLWCATIGERFVLGGGSITIESFAARLAGTEIGLDQSDLLKQGQKALGAGSGATVCWLAQRRSPIELLGEASQASALLGGGLMVPYELMPAFLDPLAGRRTLRMQLRKGRFVTEMFSPTGMAAGGLGGQPVQAEWLQRVPPDAMFAYSTAVDGTELVPKVRELFTFLGEAQSPDLAGVLGGLGPGMVTYMFPVSGIGAPQTHVWIEVDDAADFTAKITSLCEELAATQPGITVRTRTYKVKNKATGERVPFPVTTISLPPEVLDLGPLFPTSPAFATVEGQILFGLSSMNVKRELKRLYDGQGEEGAAVASNPWSAHGLAVPEDARSVVFMDWGMQIDAAISLVRALGGMLGDQIPFDLNALPAGKAFTQFLRPTVHYSRSIEGGTYRYHEASFGPETWIGIASVLSGLGG